MKLPVVLCLWAAVAAAGAPPQPPAPRVIDVPGLIEAEDPGVEHAGGLGNLPGWWAFWGNGKLIVHVRVREAGLYKVAVRAAGTQGFDPKTQERFPRMVVGIDNGPAGKLQCEVKATRLAPQVYFTPAIKLPPGRHAVSVAFVNDFGSGANDRNLFIDWVGMGPVLRPEALPALSPAEQYVRQTRQPVAAAWTFAQRGDPLGWKAIGEATVEASNDGLQIASIGDEPLLVSPRIDLPAKDQDTVSLLMKVDRGVRGEIGWIVEGHVGLPRQPFGLVADGQYHLYALEMFPNKLWTEKIIGLVLRPSDAKGATASVRLLRVGDKTFGPAEIKVAAFGLDDAVNRAQSEVRLVATLQNVGGEPAGRLTASLTLPEGVRLVEGPPGGTIESLPESADLTWRIRAETPLRGIATLKITGANFAALSASTELAFTARPAVAAATTGYVPPPQPVASDYLVGAYYFPGWKSGVHQGWPALANFPERKPALGWYQEGEPEVADWHIKWAVEHGISFFAYDWYWCRGKRQLEHALHEGFLKSRYRRAMKFCLLWANHNPSGSHSEEDLLAVTRYWLDHYFQQPEYLKIDNRPVVIIFAPTRLTDDLGVAKAKAAIEKMRTLCRHAGFEGLYLVGCTGPAQRIVADMKQEGYDAATGYNYPSAGMQPTDGKEAPYDTAIAGYRQFWETIAGFKLLDYIPVTDPGWDARPWHGENTIVRTGRHPDKFKTMLELARAFADAHPLGRQKRRVVLAEAWNEFGEGAAIEPHRQFGFGYLDAIRDVFTSAPRAHEDLVPQDVGLKVKQWVTEPLKTAWEFNTDGESEGWSVMMGLDRFEVRNGAMRAHTLTRDPAFGCPVALDAARFRYAVISMKLDKGVRAQLFWSTNWAREGEPLSLLFTTRPDRQFHTYVLDLGAVKTWRKKIVHVRLDPNCEPDAHVEIDFIRLLDKLP